MHKLVKSEARIDWSNDAVQLDRNIRAFNPWPVSFCELDGQVLRVWAAELTITEFVTKSQVKLLG